MINRKDFPGCCGACVLTGMYIQEGAEVEFLDVLRERCREIYGLNYAIITLTVNKGQRRANKLLKSLGFRHSVWTHRARRSQPIRLFYITMEDIKRLKWIK